MDDLNRKSRQEGTKETKKNKTKHGLKQNGMNRQCDKEKRGDEDFSEKKAVTGGKNQEKKKQKENMKNPKETCLSK